MQTHHMKGLPALSVLGPPLALAFCLHLGSAHAVATAEPPGSAPGQSTASAAAVPPGPSATAPVESTHPAESDSRLPLIVAGVMVVAYLIRRRAPD